MDKDFNSEKERLAYLDELLADVNNTPIYPASDVQISILEGLTSTASISEEEKDYITRNLFSFTYQEAEDKINYLKDNQTDPITSGRNYSQTDINNHLNKII